MVNKQYIKDILTNLISNTKRLDNYLQKDIDKAIIESRGVDPRTLSNWFTALWELEYILQTVPGVYVLNVSKAVNLDLNISALSLSLSLNTQVLGEAGKD